VRETGIINSSICDVLSGLGHTDELIVCDAGFSIPTGVRVVDISLGENKPTVPEVLVELQKHFSVEKVVLAEETRQTNPTRFAALEQSFGDGIPVEIIPHTEFCVRARSVKAVIRTGDFTAYSNILLVSGSGNRWYFERDT
jgi:D-ribose pyranase